jgi:hypothetical protein
MTKSSVRTVAILDDVVAKLNAEVPDMPAELFPENPAAYRLNHPKGALLLSFPGSQFDALLMSGQNIPTQPGRSKPQARTVGLTVTVVLRQLNGKDGAVDALDDVRDALRGFRPTGCRSDLQFVAERFLGEMDGNWQYAVDVVTTVWDGAAAQT